MSATNVVELLSTQVEIPLVRIVDIGANSLGGRKATYQPLIDQGCATLVGFEPDPEAFAQLQGMRSATETFVEKAVGDGQRHMLRICRMSGMNSLLEPNFAVLRHSYHHERWGQVLRTVEVPTERLDDIAEVPAVDFLKIDIQGGELMVFEHGRKKLHDCLVVQTEAMFIPMYEGQPLFADQEIELRRHGLIVHRLQEMAGHVLKPLKVNGSRHAPLSQIFHADIVFIKDFTKPERLDLDQLLKLAVILHELYWSVDVAHLFLVAYDERQGTTLAPTYMAWATSPAAQQAPAAKPL